MGDALLIFEQQRQKNITGMQSVGNDVPMPHDQIQEILQFLLTGEGVLIGHVTSPDLRQVFAWQNGIGTADQCGKEPVHVFQIHAALAERLRTLPKRSYSVSVS